MKTLMKPFSLRYDSIPVTSASSTLKTAVLSGLLRSRVRHCNLVSRLASVTPRGSRGSGVAEAATTVERIRDYLEAVPGLLRLLDEARDGDHVLGVERRDGAHDLRGDDLLRDRDLDYPVPVPEEDEVDPAEEPDVVHPPGDAGLLTDHPLQDGHRRDLFQGSPRSRSEL